MGVVETHFGVRCSACGHVYAIPRQRGAMGQVRLAARARCIQTLPSGELCGSRMHGAMLYKAKDPSYIAASALLGFVVVQQGAVDTAQAERVERAVADVRRQYEPRVAELERELADLKSTDLAQEVIRLRTRYETPCGGLVKRHADDGSSSGVVPCGGFLGHAGDCAEVWA